MAHLDNGGRARLHGQAVAFTLAGAATLIGTFGLLATLPSLDWREVLHPVATGADPYSVHAFVLPAWTAWILRPFGWLPAGPAHAAWVLAFGGLAVWAMRRAGLPLSAIAACLAAPWHWSVVAVGDVDHAVVAGYFLLNVSPAPALLLVLTKPHEIGLAVLDVRLRLRDVALLAAAAVASFGFFGFWPLEMARILLTDGPQGRSWDVSLFPWAVPMGVALAVFSFRRRDRELLGAASLLVTPYASSITIFFPVMCLLLPRLRERERWALVAAAWAIVVAGRGSLEAALGWSGYLAYAYAVVTLLLRSGPPKETPGRPAASPRRKDDPATATAGE